MSNKTPKVLKDAAIADSSFLYTIFNKDDPKHAVCVRLLAQPSIIYLPTITLPEVIFLVRRSQGVHKVPDVIRGLRQSNLEWINPELSDYDRAANLIEQYREARLYLVDTTLVGMAERLNIGRVLTLDRRDFSLIRPSHIPAFEILP